jgi:hypothetical protein
MDARNWFALEHFVGNRLAIFIKDDLGCNKVGVAPQFSEA